MPVSLWPLTGGQDRYRIITFMSYGRRQIEDHIFKTGTGDEGVANGAGRIVMVQDFKSIQLELAASGDADMTVTFYKSDQETIPDPTQASTFSNSYEPVAVRDNDDSVLYDGNTGVTLTGGEQKTYEVQSNGSRWVFAVISAFIAGSVQIRVKAYTNE